MRGRTAVLSAAVLALLAAPAAADHRELVQLSDGDGPYAVAWAGATPDGSRAYFTTPEPLVPEDTDAVNDVYERHGDRTTLVSVDGDGAGPAADVGFLGVSSDGRHVVLGPGEQVAVEAWD